MLLVLVTVAGLIYVVVVTILYCGVGFDDCTIIAMSTTARGRLMIVGVVAVTICTFMTDVVMTVV